jgi:hypothetical protein
MPDFTLHLYVDLANNNPLIELVLLLLKVLKDQYKSHTSICYHTAHPWHVTLVKHVCVCAWLGSPMAVARVQACACVRQNWVWSAIVSSK